MGQPPHTTKLRMDSPTRYRILVQGGLDESWTNRLGGLAIKMCAHAQIGMVTELSGEVLDQAALFGVVNTLYELRLPLISITPLGITSEGGCE